MARRTCGVWHNKLFVDKWTLSSVDGHKHKKSLRQKLDSLSKEKSKDKGRGCFCCCSCHLLTNHLLSEPETEQTRWSWRSELFVFVENWAIRIWRALKMPEGALTATPTATMGQESNVSCQKSSGGEKIKTAPSFLHPQLFTRAPQKVFCSWLNILSTVSAKAAFLFLF